MDNQLKKISYSVFLDPTQNESDYFAYKIMQRWAKQQKQYAQDPAAAVQLHNQIHIHKDIYLSGLFLHQLKPELAKALASALTENTLNKDTLCNLLSAHQMFTDQDPSYQFSMHSTQDGGIEPLNQAVTKLDDIASALVQPVLSNDVDTGEIVAQLAALLAPQQAEVTSEIRALKKVIEQQRDHIQRLIQSVHQVPINTAKATVIQPTNDVSERLNNVKKIKNKGIF
ncbi:hypothetical protein RCJ22_13310 [Vibrio sp. FNV 38]|nr:hypothetical protein [Vibrio sp. FNV 38]